MRIDGSTRLVGVFGAPIHHTASPAMHNAAFTALGLNWAYLAFHVPPDRLAAALRAAAELGLAGVNLTVPHKVLALDCVDTVDDEARRLGAVNTVRFAAGRTEGFNTDGHGFVEAMREEFGLDLRGQRVLVLGAGGAGRALAVKSALAGAAEVLLANRTRDKLEAVAQEVERAGVNCTRLGMDRAALAAAMGRADVIVNATSVGLRAGESLDLDPAGFAVRQVVYDTIYQPPETALLRQARAAGARAANGLSMLLHQGARAFTIWTGQPAPVAVMREALRAAGGSL